MKDLLRSAMPEFEPVPDRVDQVRLRVKARRDRRVVGGAAAAGLEVAVGAGVVAAQPSQDAQLAAPQVCRFESFAKLRPRLIGANPYPENATKATLCVFSGAGWDASEAEFFGKVEQQDTSEIVRKLNENSRRPGECSDVTRTCRLILEYPDREPVQVALRADCHLGRSVTADELLRGTVAQALDHLTENHPMRLNFPR